jgi:hypothetical protein
LMACASADALPEARVFNTTKKPSLANFWAMVPPFHLDATRGGAAARGPPLDSIARRCWTKRATQRDIGRLRSLGVLGSAWMGPSGHSISTSRAWQGYRQ